MHHAGRRQHACMSIQKHLLYTQQMTSANGIAIWDEHTDDWAGAECSCLNDAGAGVPAICI